MGKKGLARRMLAVVLSLCCVLGMFPTAGAVPKKTRTHTPFRAVRPCVISGSFGVVIGVINWCSSGVVNTLQMPKTRATAELFGSS